MAIPMPMKNRKSIPFKEPKMKSKELGMAKIKKKTSFFSKKPGSGTWWSSWKYHMNPCITYLCMNQAMNSMKKKVPMTINAAILKK